MTDQAGNKTTYTYDALNRLTEALTKSSGGSTTADYRYTLDGNGNLLQETTGSGTTSYAYNADNQTCWSYTGSNTNACSSPPSGAHAETYDLNGNLTSTGSGITLTYNALDQTTALNGIAYSYWGEGQNQRVGGGQARFSYDQLGLSSRSEYGETISLTRDPNGQLVDQRGASNYYPLLDGQGSIIALTDSSGHLANTYAYDPNGNRTSQTGSAPAYWGFQGGYMVDNGLYHYGARYYNPAQATWTQQDPLNQTSSLTQADRYVFAGDNPVNEADPSGADAVCLTRHDCPTYSGRTTGGPSAVDACTVGTIMFGVVTEDPVLAGMLATDCFVGSKVH